MKKPGDSFGFQPKNSLASVQSPEFDKQKHGRRKRRSETAFHILHDLVAPEQHQHRCPKPPTLPTLEIASMVNQQAPPKAPLRPLGTSEANEKDNGSQSLDKTPGFTNTGSLTSGNRPPSSTDPTSRPAIKSSAFKGSDLEDKYANLFIQPKSRPEHHRPQRINGPLQPSFKDKRPPPPAMYSTMPAPIGSAGNPIAVVDGPPISRYSQPGTFSQYTDPKKAQSDLKALLEGSVDDEEKLVKEDEIEEKSHIEGLKVQLLPHQVEGVEWMKGRELGPVKKGKVPKGGLLADDMGLGKTLQSMSLILTNKKPADKHPGVEKTTLVVAPLALIRQWESELKEKITDSHRLKVLVHHGPQRTKRFEDLRRYDVVITTYQILVSEHNHTTESLKTGCFGLHWYRVILDEAHTIKNRNAKATKACYDLRSVYRWCLSGTPMQNNLDELQSLVKFLRIKPYDDIREWKDNFELPMKQGKGDVALRRLHSVLDCFMKRRTKDILKQAGALSTGRKDAQDGEKSTTSSFKVTERKVVSIAAQFSPAEKRFYDRLEQRTDKSIEQMLRGKINYASALVLLLRLRQACNHPKLVEGKLEKDRDALSEETRPKKTVTDVDDLADLLGGMAVEATHCEICGWQLDHENRQHGSDKCKACFADLEYFKHNEEGGELKAPKMRTRKKKSKVTKVVKEKIEPKAVTKRKQRNRRAIIDSDDEEEEADWIVSGDEQGPLRLGKAGGTDDENAEGEGETINSEDSEEEESRDGSRLDSFIVEDGDDLKPGDLQRALEESDSDTDDDDDDDDLESLSALRTKKLPRKSDLSTTTAGDSVEAGSEAGSEEDETDTGISESELDNSDTDSDGSAYYKSGSSRPKEKTPHVLASAKIRQLISILHKEVHEHKFIVFSQFTSMLDLVEPFFRKEGIKYVRYDGGMRNDAREASLESLRQDPRTRVLLCSLRCGALGLNLTAASRVVILEPFWNPFVEEQAIDRVHRLTQTVDVVVYKITIEHSVEARILELQERKRLLAEQAIEMGQRKDGAMKLGLNEIIDLFKHVGGSSPSRGDDDYDGSGKFADEGTVRQDVAGSLGMMRSKKGKGRVESEIYGRRW
ncbi:SNF2 family N-terminal domain-containing protein [Xylariomycetidae sp. FL2044]|nr:SNF2 family N-terminal domain-containing protein [Xylariomycetidae sp. FL2044]